MGNLRAFKRQLENVSPRERERRRDAEKRAARAAARLRGSEKAKARQLGPMGLTTADLKNEPDSWQELPPMRELPGGEDEADETVVGEGVEDDPGGAGNPRDPLPGQVVGGDPDRRLGSDAAPVVENG